ncbi:hypothetical protein DB31_2727 [Hyalangium minutum]|uniref:Uncharacterized protein n=1 Tax=Hyalangium minutum TaxID=394096 RepID=A0A085W7E6_9BACT|nr:hypothetical protein DB31_2727 [Hyalangium minutum]
MRGHCHWPAWARSRPALLCASSPSVPSAQAWAWTSPRWPRA